MLLIIDSRLEVIGFLNLFSKVTAMRSNNFFLKCDAFVSLSFCVKLLYRKLKKKSMPFGHLPVSMVSASYSFESH